MAKKQVKASGEVATALLEQAGFGVTTLGGEVTQVFFKLNGKEYTLEKTDSYSQNLRVLIPEIIKTLVAKVVFDPTGAVLESKTFGANEKHQADSWVFQTRNEYASKGIDFVLTSSSYIAEEEREAE